MTCGGETGNARQGLEKLCAEQGLYSGAWGRW